MILFLLHSVTPHVVSTEGVRPLQIQQSRSPLRSLQRVSESGNTLSSDDFTPQVQKVLGDHLTAMIENQARKATFGYNMLLMQTVLEVFMTHWCSSIIEAFYPQQVSFADLLVHLSAKTTEVTEHSGKWISLLKYHFKLSFNPVSLYRIERHLWEAD